MAFIIVTEAQDDGRKFLVNTDDIKFAYAVGFTEGGWHDRARVRIVARDGSEFLIRETPNALIAALQATQV